MTIIISCLTPKYVVQVSDRRVVWINSRKQLEQIDDNSNKAVNYCHRMAFGYTGLAEFEVGIRTDIWLTNALASLPRRSIDHAVEAIRIKATASFRSLKIADPVLRRHAFVGVGWAIPRGEDAFRPLFVNISNFHNERGEQLPRAGDEFTVNVEFLHDKDPGAFCVTGRPLSPDLVIELRRCLRKCARKNVGPLTVIQVFARTVRQMASRFDDVGSNLMALSIPKSTVELESPFYLSSVPSNNTHTFLYLPQELDREVTYGPNYVCGGTALTGFSITTGEKVKTMAPALDVVSPLDFYDTVVATSWVGSGSFGDSRHPEVADHYELDAYGVISDVPSWSRDEACPYYGCLVGINAADHVVDRLRKDKRFLVIYTATNKVSVPDQGWITHLKTWLVVRGIPEFNANRFVEDVHSRTRLEIAKELDVFLRHTLRYRAAQD